MFKGFHIFIKFDHIFLPQSITIFVSQLFFLAILVLYVFFLCNLVFSLQIFAQICVKMPSFIDVTPLSHNPT